MIKLQEVDLTCLCSICARSENHNEVESIPYCNCCCAIEDEPNLHHRTCRECPQSNRHSHDPVCAFFILCLGVIKLWDDAQIQRFTRRVSSVTSVEQYNQSCEDTVEQLGIRKPHGAVHVKSEHSIQK